MKAVGQKPLYNNNLKGVLHYQTEIVHLFEVYLKLRRAHSIYAQQIESRKRLYFNTVCISF